MTLWVKSRHWAPSERCPLYPKSTHWGLSCKMSALCQKQTFAHAWSVAGRAIPWAFVVLGLTTRALNSDSVVGTSKIWEYQKPNGPGVRHHLWSPQKFSLR